MRYYSEPWRNRVLGDGWSHNPYKRIIGMEDDPDIRATLIAEKYIGLMTEYLRQRGWLPLVGVEINFTPYGIDAQQLVDTMAGMQHDARRRLHAGQPEAMPGGSVLPLHLALQALPVWADPKPNTTDGYDLDFAHMEVRGKEAKPDGKGALPFDLSVLLEGVNYEMDDKLVADFARRAEAFKHGDPLTQYDINQCYLLMRMLAGSAERGAILRIDPALWNAMKGLCEAITRERAYDPHAGMISRIYLDGSAERVEDPEITTPPRAPLTTIRHVNDIKQMLMESTYRFRNDHRTSRSASALRDKVGDIDVSFLDPEGYYNLAEHLNFSVLACDETLRDYADLRRHPSPDKQNVTRDTQAILMRGVFQSFLPADRLLTIGNRFPYDEAVQLDARSLHAKIDRADRIAGRVELTNFHDATSNVALSTLSVMSVACMLRERMDAGGVGAAVDETSELVNVLGSMGKVYKSNHVLPRSPREAVRTFNESSASLQAMRMVGEAMLGKDALPEIEQDIVDFKAAAIKRHALLVKRPWGGKVRAAQERANGWRVAHAEREEQGAASDRGPGL